MNNKEFREKVNIIKGFFSKKKEKEAVTELVHTTKIRRLSVVCDNNIYNYTDEGEYGLGVYNDGKTGRVSIYMFKSYPREWGDALLLSQFPKTCIVSTVNRELVTYEVKK